MNRYHAIAAAAPALLTLSANAQTTVDYTDPSWTDLGTTDVVAVMGNFLPGWTSINATPDLGDDLFFIPNESLSGADDDAAIWMNQFAPTSPLASQNEIARLSLSGYTIGQTYELSFSATLYLSTPSGWSGNDDSLDVALTGADISDWDSTTLSDPGDIDGLNDWVAQTITFTALSDTVTFDFGANPEGSDDATRFGIDGFSSSLVPAPGATAFLAMGALTATRRRRA